MRKHGTRAAALGLSLALLLGLCACGGATEHADGATPQFSVVVAGLSVDLERTEQLRQTLPQTLADLLAEGETVAVTELLLGEEANATQVGIVMNGKAASMFAGGMVDLMLASRETVGGYAAADCLMPVSDLFSPEELEELGLTAQRFEILDSENEPTGEWTGELGLDVSHVAALAELLPGVEEVTLCVAGNASDPEQCREAICRLVRGE